MIIQFTNHLTNKTILADIKHSKEFKKVLLLDNNIFIVNNIIQDKELKFLRYEGISFNDAMSFMHELKSILYRLKNKGIKTDRLGLLKSDLILFNLFDYEPIINIIDNISWLKIYPYKNYEEYQALNLSYNALIFELERYINYFNYLFENNKDMKIFGKKR